VAGRLSRAISASRLALKTRPRATSRRTLRRTYHSFRAECRLCARDHAQNSPSHSRSSLPESCQTLRTTVAVRLRDAPSYPCQHPRVAYARALGYHIKSVAKQPCLVCGRRPADAHHLRFAQSPALGRKVSDEFTVPLCRGHHREVHRCGDEAAWWKRTGIDPSAAARVLWLKSHPLPSAIGQAGSKLRNEANLEAGSL